MQLPISRYSELLQKKYEKLTALLRPFNAPEIQVFASPPSHYRMRAEFRIWHEQGDFYHIMFDQTTKQRYRIDEFPIAGELINRMMKSLPALLKEQEVLHQKLFQIDYLSTLSNQIIVSLLYHKPLLDEWQRAAKNLKEKLTALGFDLQIIGRASKQKICLERDYADEILSVAGRNYVYRQVENSFTQPNAAVNCKMLEWAIDCTKNSEGDLQIIRMSAEEFTQVINGVREFNRLKGIDLKSYECNTIFVDPPRAGLDSETVKLVRNYDRILYISCNPRTLCDNLVELSKTHRIERAALFDQFPYTDHMESGVWLIRK